MIDVAGSIAPSVAKFATVASGPDVGCEKSNGPLSNLWVSSRSVNGTRAVLSLLCREENSRAPMLVHKWFEAALAHSGLSGADLARLLTKRLGRKFDRSIIAKMRTPPLSADADLSHPDSRRVRRAIKVDELFAIAQITGFALPPELMIGQRVELVPNPDIPDGIPDFSGSDEVTESRVDTARREKPAISKNHISATKSAAATKSQQAVITSATSELMARGVELVEPDSRARASSVVLRNILAKSGDDGVNVMSDVPPEAIKDRWLIPSNYLRGLMHVRGEALLWEVLGDSGYDPEQPETRDSIRPGDRVVVDLSDNQPSPPGAFLVFDGIGALIKWIEIVDEPAGPEVSVRISSKNPRYTDVIVPASHARILGRVRARISLM